MKKNIILGLLITLLIISCDNSNNNGSKESSENDPENHTTAKVSDSKNTSNIKYETYCNGRFGFCIDYPLNILFPQGESANGDGQVFMSKDAENTLWVYRDYRDNTNPKEAYDISLAFEEDTWADGSGDSKRVVTYKHLGKNYYVVSGYNNGKIFYQKTILTTDGLATALIEYREKEKDFYDKVSEQIFKTFKWHEHKWIES